MGFKVGKDCKISLAANKVVGMGDWSMTGISTEEHDISEFQVDWKKFEMGLKDGGSIAVSGLFDPDNSPQEQLREANLHGSDLATVRLYIDKTSYYEPCQTTGYWSPTTTTSSAPTVKSWVNVRSFNVKADKNGMVQIDFQLKVSGLMVLV